MLAVLRNVIRPTVVARGLGTSRLVFASNEATDDGLPKDYKQVEKLILGGQVRVNEETMKKKSHYIEEGDVIDVWNNPYAENSELAEVDRIEVHGYQLTEKGYDIRVHHWKKFLVENWKGS